MSIEAMKQALDALCMPCDRWNKVQTIKVNEAITSLRQAIAEAEKQDKFHENWQEIDCPACGTLAKAKFQFYTHPQPKREWVGLTYEDMVSLQKDLHDQKGEIVLPTTFAKAIEAKLKEKNI